MPKIAQQTRSETTTTSTMTSKQSGDNRLDCFFLLRLVESKERETNKKQKMPGHCQCKRACCGSSGAAKQKKWTKIQKHDCKAHHACACACAHKCVEPVPVFGQIEVCNQCETPLRTENAQLSTSRDINGIPAGTSMADLLAMLVTKDRG